MEKTKPAEPAPPDQGVIVNGVNVKDMTDEQLQEAVTKAMTAAPLREQEWVAAVQAHVNFRIVLGVLIFEHDRRQRSISLRGPGAGRLVT